MSADRGRLTHYPPRKYREVVSQQGRVLLDADANESQRIGTEELRREALDVVGPVGTPDDGYQVVPSGSAFQVNRGTMYVGGLRVTLESTVQYEKQPEWLDNNAIAPWGDGLWRDPAVFQKLGAQVTLVLREQEITAVEDPALRDVALGGPDTCARTRLLQRIVAVDTKAQTCAGATAAAIDFWSTRGLVYDPDTASLTARARLLVTPVTNPPAPSPCDPPSASGYLGADNQMLRVMITQLDGTTNAGTLIWGYYNASMLYRATVQTATTVRLATRPVSAEFQPRTGQVVQVLLRAADLGEGAFAAALTGHVAKLTTPYAPDTQIVTLPAALPQPPHGNGTNVYVRLWEDQVAFTVGTPVELADTGLQVTITKASAGALHIGDYWQIAVRPLTPNTVYPERLLAAPQPPDGPRMWACPLAVIGPGGKPVKVFDDCRRPFDNLVELTAREFEEGCACTVCVTPDEHLKGAPSLQLAIDTVIKAGGGTVCLEVGKYPLKEPLRIRNARSLTLAGKYQASVIEAASRAIEVSESSDIRLEAFTIRCDKSVDHAIVLRTTEGVRIEDVDIVNDSPEGSGIGLNGALTQVVIRDNTIVAAFGVVDVPDQKIGAIGVEGLLIEDNRITARTGGIRLRDAIVHQQVTRIAGNHIRGCDNVGIRLTGVIADEFGIEVLDNELQVAGDGIQFSVDRVRVVNNDVTPLKSQPNVERRGIAIVKGVMEPPVDHTQIVGNRVTGFGVAIMSEVEVGALLVTDNQIAHARMGVIVQPMVGHLIIDRNQMLGVSGSAIGVETKNGRVAACGNQLEIVEQAQGEAEVPGVVVLGSGEVDCLFTDNHIRFMKALDGPGVELRGGPLVVTSNRITSKITMLLRTGVTGQKQPTCTVLGNIVGGEIRIITPATPAAGAPLPAPWAPLNLQGI